MKTDDQGSSRKTYMFGRRSGGTKPAPESVNASIELARDPASEETQHRAIPLITKKLPWLDGPQQSKPGHMPGQFGHSKESLIAGDANFSPSIEKNQIGAASKPSLQPLSTLVEDPTLRASGSLPSLDRRTGPNKFRSLSLGSRPEPRLKMTKSSDDLKQATGGTSSFAHSPEYSSSEYSTAFSEPKGYMSLTNPVKAVLPSKQLTERRRSKHSDVNGPISFGNPWRKSRVELTFDSEILPRQQTVSAQKTSECRSCDEPTRQLELSQLRKLRKVQTMPSRPVARAASKLSVRPNTDQSNRRSTLFAMPTHLLGSSSPSSVSPPSRVLPSPNRSQNPGSAWRASNAALQGRQTYSLTHAVSGLETLMNEALHVARDAAHSGRNEEVAKILDDATVALRKASTVHQQIRNGRSSQPLVLSPVPSAHYSESDESVGPGSNLSSLHSKESSSDTAPTVLTKSANSSRQPILVEFYNPEAHLSRPLKATVRDARDIDPLSEDSIANTPPGLYQPPSAESIVRDFAYKKKKNMRATTFPVDWGAAADYYDDAGESVETQPGVRRSINPPMIQDNSRSSRRQSRTDFGHRRRYKAGRAVVRSRSEEIPLRPVANTSRPSIPPRQSSRTHQQVYAAGKPTLHHRRDKSNRHSHISRVLESPYYRPPVKPPSAAFTSGLTRAVSSFSGAGDDQEPEVEKAESIPQDSERYGGTPTDLQKVISLKHPRRKHISLREGQGFSLGRFHRRQPIAREWSNSRKRMTAAIACMNTVFIGLIAGIYAGEVPRMQYQLADTTHKVILGNVLLFACLGITTLIFWPLPLLHGRKPYTLLSFAIVLPLLFPQAISVTGYHSPNQAIYRAGLLVPRAFEGLALGFANINFLPTLFDLFGASLMSERPHQEIVVYDDVRRQGGGVGVWLGIWSFCFVGSMSIGFCIGACIISALDPSWGFYIIVMLLAFFLLVNVVAPETRRSPYRRSISQFFDHEDNLKRRVARGEVKLHISNEGPKFWFQEVWAGLILTKRMASQTGFFVLMLYLGWMYAQVTLVILLLGALLSRDYRWQPQYVGAASLSMAIGAFIAVPLSSANMFSRARNRPQRTDSMTMRHGRVTWTSHMLRRCLFTLTLPFAALAYTLSSPGPSVSWVTPAVFCGLVGFLSNLAIAECVGLIMETFDTCDLQPGVNSKHRLQSLAETTRRRRTNYSSFPRVCAGFFAAQSLGFLLSAAATGVSGVVTRAVGAQTATAIVAAILLFLTVLFIGILWRWKEVQVVPNNPFGVPSEGGIVWGPAGEDPEWKAVIIGNPSGKMRRVNLLELGNLSRWTEIRKLNKLVRN